MGLFSFFSRIKCSEQIDAHKVSDLELFAPVGGTLLSLREVPDLVISEKLIGDGVAIAPERSTNMIYAPCDGTISRITASNNAFTIKRDNGLEIYVTFGIGTNAFTGKGLSSRIIVGAKVTQGTPIINIDMQVAKEDLESAIVSMIVVNSSADIAKVISSRGKAQAAKTPCAWVYLKDSESTND